MDGGEWGGGGVRPTIHLRELEFLTTCSLLLNGFEIYERELKIGYYYSRSYNCPLKESLTVNKYSSANLQILSDTRYHDRLYKLSS